MTGLLQGTPRPSVFQKVWLDILVAMPVIAGLALIGTNRTTAYSVVQGTPQRADFPYWTVDGSFRSTLGLNNAGNTDLTVSPTVYNREGQPLALPPIVLGPQRQAIEDLGTLIAQTGKASAFKNGSLTISYQGDSYFLLGGQLVISDPLHGLSFDVRNEMIAGLKSSKLEGTWWLPDDSYDYQLVLTNTTGSPVSLSVSFFGNGAASDAQPQTTVLSPHETRTLDLKSQAAGAAKDANLGKFGGVSITHQGSPGAILAYGMLSKVQLGFASRFFFADPAQNASASLAAAHIMVGSPDLPGLDSRANFDTIALISNTSDDPISVSPSVSMSIGGQWKTISLSTTRLAGQQIEALDVGSELARRGVTSGISGAGLSIQSTGKPGALQAYVTSFDRTGKNVFDVPVKDANDPNNARGGNHPVNLQGNNHAVLFLRNVETPDPTPKLRTAVVELWFPGGTYSFPMQTIGQGQTVALDITQVRDAQIKDPFGNVLPKDLQVCQVQWYGRDSMRFIGRLVVYDPLIAVSSSFSCLNACVCPPSFTDGFISPGSIQGVVGNQAALSVTEQDTNCSATVFTYPVTSGVLFSTSNPSVITTNGFTATLVGVGSARITATWGSQTVTDNGPCLPGEICGERCSAFSINATASSSVTSRPTVSISGNAPTSLVVGTRGNQIALSASGSPAGGAYSWSTSSGHVSLTNATSPSVTVTAASASSAQGDVTITVSYSLNGQQAQASIKLTVKSPTSLGLVSTTSQSSGNCGTGSAGWMRIVQWQILDQFGGPIRLATDVADVINNSQPNTCGVGPATTGNGFSNANGQFPDTFSFCSPGCIAGSCQLQAAQTWVVNGVVMPNGISVFYTCRSITLNGQ